MWCIFVYLYCNSTVHQTEWMMRVNMNAHTLANWPEWLAVLLSPTCKLTEMSPSDWIDRPYFLPASPAMFAPLWCTFMYFEVVLGTFWYLGVLWGAFRYFEVLLGALAKLLDVHQPWSLHHFAVLCSARHIDLISRGRGIGKSIFEPTRLVFICQMATLTITLKSKSPRENDSGLHGWNMHPTDLKGLSDKTEVLRNRNGGVEDSNWNTQAAVYVCNICRN